MLAQPWRERLATVTAAAERVSPRTDAAGSRHYRRPLLVAAIAFAPFPASAAQVGAVASIYSDNRFRGLSVSDGRPVGILDVSYDAANGLYASLSGTVVATRGEGFRALSAVFNGGYAKRLHSGLTADVGVVHSRYSHYSALISGRNYTEAYAGLSGRFLAGRISVSPDYFGVARWTTHGELDAHLNLSRNAVLEAETGVLVPLGHSAYEGNVHTQVDARLGLARTAGPLTFHAAVTGRSGNDEIYSGHDHHRVALVLGISAAL